MAAVTATVSAFIAVAVEKNGRFTTRDLASGLAYLILPSGPFFTLIWGWNNFPIITAAAAKNWLAASVILLIANPLFTPDLTPADLFLFPKLVVQLAGLSFAQESLKRTWVGVSRTVTTETFAAAFCRWFEWHEKCVRIGGG